MAVGRIDATIREVAERYAEVLRQEMTLRGLYVYGSYAKGSADADSDIDIAVISDAFTGDRIDDTLLLMRLRRKVDTRIEPRPFSSEEFGGADPLAAEVSGTGVRVV